MTPDICIYHGNCADGFTAAWAVWKRFGDSVEYIPGVYGESPPDVTGKNVVIVDFSYKRPVLLEMTKTARTVLVLDHHKTAEADLAQGGVSSASWLWVYLPARFTGNAILTIWRRTKWKTSGVWFTPCSTWSDLARALRGISFTRTRGAPIW